MSASVNVARDSHRPLPVMVTTDELALLSALRDLNNAAEAERNHARKYGHLAFADGPVGDAHERLTNRAMDLAREAQACARMAGLLNIEVGAAS